eukprot:XP_014036606.1 PREDICTED: vesicular, overexpressed in cancer, prosurvival protein 1-like isoform X2 [Salmo salar]
MKNLLPWIVLTFWIFLECVEAKKSCWYFEGGYPIYFMLMLMMGVLFCCGAGFFIRRRMYPLPLSVDPAFNVSFTRQPVSTPVSQQPGMVGYGDPGVMTSPLTPTYPIQPGPAHMSAYPPPPSYCNHPPPPYEQVFRTPEKR